MSSQPDQPSDVETDSPSESQPATISAVNAAPPDSTPAGESPSDAARAKGPAIRIGTQRYGVKPPTAVPRPVIGSPNIGRAAEDATDDTGNTSADAPAAASSDDPSSDAGQTSTAAEPSKSKDGGRGPGSKKKSPQSPRFTSEPAPVRKYPPPNIRSQLSPELEVEFLEALGEQSMEEVFAGEAEKVVAELEPESRHNAQVVAIHRDDVFLQIGGRQQGILSLRVLETVPEIGAILDVVVGRFNAGDGLYEMTLPGAAVSVEDWSQVHEGLTVEARVTGHNKGGLECDVNRLRGFIPASQVSAYRVEDLSQFVGQSMICIVTEVNPEKRNLVLSHRAVMEREKAEAKEKLMAELAPGQLREGTVRSLQDFGAFVDLGGVDGLIHISQLSWDRIRHASEVLEVGQAVKVKIVKIDPQTGKIGLAFRDLSESPWATAAQDYPVRTRVKGKVSRLMDFGAFVRLGPGVEGLIHISELSHKRVFRVADVLQEGQEVEVMVLSVDAEQQRISLSLKALEARPSTEKPAEPEPEEAAAPVVASKKRQVPLKGGIGGPATGDKFGLRW